MRLVVAAAEETRGRVPVLVGCGYGTATAVELMVRIAARMGDRLIYIGGLPTAETFALPYREMGVHAGPVRPPLTDLMPKEVDELRGLIEKVRSR